MSKKALSAAALSPSFIEPLEGRVLLSAAGTVTSISMTPGGSTLGQDLMASVTVKTTTGARVEHGTVEILDEGTVIASASLSGSKGTISGDISSVLNATAGSVFYAGNNVFKAEYLGKGSQYIASTSKKTTVAIAQPALRGHSSGLRVATVRAGSGPAAKTGQSVTVSYTGYLTDGQIFDSTVMEAPSSSDGTGELTFTLGDGGTVTGFNNGIVGMQVGETRVIVIPPSMGYGNNPPSSAGPSGVIIPANAELIFVVTLDAI